MFHFARNECSTSPEYAAILRRLLRKNPSERFQTGAELEAALRERLAELGQPYGAHEAAEEVLLAKAESRGIVLKEDGKSMDIQPEVLPMRNADEISTQPS